MQVLISSNRVLCRVENIRKACVLVLQPAAFNSKPPITAANRPPHLDTIEDEEESDLTPAATVVGRPGQAWAESASTGRQPTVTDVAGSVPTDSRRRISVMEMGNNVEDIQRLVLDEYRRERERVLAVKTRERERADEKLKEMLEQNKIRRQNTSTLIN